MAAPTVTKRGKASLEGIAGTFDVIIYPLAQTGKMTANFDEEIVKDQHGFACAWNARDLHYLNDYGFKLLGDTQAHALSGAAFLQPYATVTLSGFDAAPMNGVYQTISGQEIDLGNTKVGDLALKLRKYDDAGQNTAATTAPS